MKRTLKTGLLMAGLLTQSLVLFGQNREILGKNQLKFSPLRVVDLINPGFEIGFERRHGRLSSQLSAAYMKDPFGITNFHDYNGYRLSLEEKYFVKRKQERNFYYAMELAYLDVKYQAGSTYSKDTTQNSPRYFDTYGVVKKTIALNFKVGLQVPYKRIVLDLSAGFGMKYKSVRRNGVDDSNAFEQLAVDVNANDMANEEGKRLAPNVPLCIKIAFSF